MSDAKKIPMSKATSEQILKDTGKYDGVGVQSSLALMSQQMAVNSQEIANEFLGTLFNRYFIQKTLDTFKFNHVIYETFKKETFSISDNVLINYIDNAVPKNYKSAERVPVEFNYRSTFTQQVPTKTRKHFDVDVSKQILEGAFTSDGHFNSFVTQYMTKPEREKELYKFNIMINGDPSYVDPDGTTPKPFTSIIKDLCKVRLKNDESKLGRYNVELFLPLPKLDLNLTPDVTNKDKFQTFIYNVSRHTKNWRLPSRKYSNAGLVDAGTGEFEGIAHETARVGEILIMLLPYSMESGFENITYSNTFNPEFLKSYGFNEIRLIGMPDSFFESFTIPVAEIGKPAGSTTALPTQPVKVQAIICTDESIHLYERIDQTFSNEWAANMTVYFAKHFWLRASATLYPSLLITEPLV